MTARVWLVRHGATIAPPGVAIGSSDPPLSEAGRAQADELADRLASAQLTRVISSDLVRAIETARPIAARHGLAVEPVRALREIDFGEWEGRALTALWSEEEASFRNTPRGFGETFTDLEFRVTGWWHTVLAALEGEVAIIAHRGSLAVLSAAITGCSVEAAFADRIEPGQEKGPLDSLH